MPTQVEDLGLAIKKVQSRHHRSLDNRLSQVGISLVQWNALREIERNPGSSAHRLAELTFNSDQAFGTLTTRLERLGFVERQPGDGRAILHSLTADGRQMLDKGRKIYLHFLRMAFAPLNADERSLLLNLLTRLLDRS